MRNSFFGFVLVLSCLVVSCARAPTLEGAQPKVLGGSTGEYRGSLLLSQILGERLNEGGGAIPLHSFVGGDDMLALLGSVSTVDGVSRFQNGNPNTINVLLYSVLFRSVANILFAQVCQGDFSNPDFIVSLKAKEKLLPLCSWPAPEARSDAVLEGIWITLLSYDAPRAEELSWADFMRSKEIAIPAEKAFSDAIYTAFMNPHFILQK